MDRIGAREDQAIVVKHKSLPEAIPRREFRRFALTLAEIERDSL